MPRQLPWNLSGKSAVGSPRSTPSSSAATVPARSPAPERGNSVEVRSAAVKPRTAITLTPRHGTPGSVARSGRSRSPSTSPPPMRVEPLPEEPMIEGVDNDDQFRMVEDEFLAVAGEFTRHLHAAEYQRLKEQLMARAANREAIVRPVVGGGATDGETAELIERRRVALDVAAKQRKGIARALGKREADSDGEGAGKKQKEMTSLQGLMDSPRKKAVPLAQVLVGSGRQRIMVAGSPSRRGEANVEIEETTSAEEDDEEEDLELPRWPSRGRIRIDPHALDRPLKREVSPVIPAKRERSSSRHRSTSRVSTWPQARAITAEADLRSASRDTIRPDTTKTTAPQRINQSEQPGDDDDDDDPIARMRARRAEQKRRRESRNQDAVVKNAESETTALNEIPFFHDNQP